MNRLTILVLFIFSALSSLHAQRNNTYLGHKYVAEVNCGLYYGVLAPFVYDEYDGSSLLHKSSRSRVETSLQLALLRHLAGKTAFGVEFDYFKSIYAPNPSTFYSNGSYASYSYEKMDVNCMAFIGKFEFGRRDGVFPLGVTHQVGAGLLVISPQKKEGSLYARPDDAGFEDTLVNYKMGSALGMTAFYNLNFRVNVSKRFFMNTGIRYNFNYVFKKHIESSQLPDVDGMAQNIREKLSLNLMRFYIGAAFTF